MRKEQFSNPTIYSVISFVDDSTKLCNYLKRTKIFLNQATNFCMATLLNFGKISLGYTLHSMI